MEAARRLLGIALLCVASVNCSFERVPDMAGPKDGGLDAIPDAGMCPALSAECIGDTLRECTQVGELPVDTSCPWGCLKGGGSPRCGKLQPTGTVVLPADLMPAAGLVDINRVITGTIGTINTDDGTITNVRTMGTGLKDGIDYQQRTFDAGGATGTRGVAVFRFKSLALSGDWLVRGSRALVIVSLGDVDLQGRFDLKGDCVNSNAGPGGFPGGAASTTAAGVGGGAGGAPSGNESSGGGGGGHGAAGGDGGRAPSSAAGRPAGGAVLGDDKITLLLGGGGGGGGGTGGRGGGGGGALHIVANGKVTIRSLVGLPVSGINAGGCGGARANQDAGGGGGAGGAVLIEATSVDLDGANLAVNGGGGGAGNAGGTGDGANASLDNTAAAGGPGGGAGGAGGAGATRTGAQGTDAGDGGGGGGGIGRIRVNTRTQAGVTLVGGAIVSPSFDDMGSTATKDVAIVQ